MLQAVTVLFIFVIVLLTIILIFVYKRLVHKEQELCAIKKELNQASSFDNRRKSFRVDLTMIECKFKEISIGHKDVEESIQKQGMISDLSVTGMQLRTESDLPVREPVVLEISFQIKDHPFHFIGIVRRKFEFMNKLHLTYGIEFKELSSRDRKALFHILNQIEIEKKKK